METEKSKMQAGRLYDANYDAELLAERAKCAERLHALNRLCPSQEKERREMLRQLFGKTGERFTVLSPFFCDYGYNIEIGEDFFMNMNCVILDEAKVVFGNHVFVGPQCGFYTAGHPLDAPRRNRGLEYARPIAVGDHVWIGGQGCVLPGVTIGHGAVIGAASVVTRDVPPGVLAAGNPCRVIREISEQDEARWAE